MEKIQTHAILFLDFKSASNTVERGIKIEDSSGYTINSLFMPLRVNNK